MKTFTLTKNMTLTLAAAALLSACAPRGNDPGLTDLSSRLSDTTTSTKSVASCNQASNAGTTVKLRAYVDASGAVLNQYMIVRLSELPSSFKSSQSYISMWRWMANPGGNTYLDSVALRFKIMNPATNSSVTDWKTTIRWSDVSTAASNLGYSDAQSFFSAMKIIVDLQDANGDFDVLKVTTYDASTNKSVGEVDALLPLFYANPTDYAYEANGSARASVLKTLHPFKSYADQGYSTSQFVSMANAFCF